MQCHRLEAFVNSIYTQSGNWGLVGDEKDHRNNVTKQPPQTEKDKLRKTNENL